MSKNVSDFVIESLVNQGVEDFFMLPGGGCMYLVDALARRPEVEVITLLHEQSVGVAAEAHSQYSNQISVALVTTGPGATNAVTPCAAAWTDSTPVVFISGQVKTADSRLKYGVRQLGFQEIPISEIVSPITKAARTVSDPADIPMVIKEMIEIAQSGRPGPVWIDIPLDVQNAPCPGVPIKKLDRVRAAESASESVIDDLVIAWNKARKPLLLIGNGVRISGCIKEFEELSRLTSTPALLTWKALDLMDENDILNAGRPGAIAQRWSNFAQQTCDFILCIGARMDLGQVAYRMDTFAPQAQKFFADIDPLELQKFGKIDAVSLHIDAKVLIKDLLEKARKEELHPDTHSWISRIQEWKTKYPLIQSKHLHPRSGVNLYYFIEELSKALLPSDVIVPGSSGACSEITMQAFKVKSGQRVLNSEALGPMGFGIPATIGACIASGRRRVISLDGDGGFLMNVQELASIAYLNLPIKIFVLNNGGYGSIKSSQDSYFDGRRLGTDTSNGLALPDLEKMTLGFGLRFERIQSHSEIEASLKRILSDEVPTIIELIVDPDQVTEPRTTTQVLSDGSFETSPMQFLKPLLNEAELKQELGF